MANNAKTGEETLRRLNSLKTFFTTNNLLLGNQMSIVNCIIIYSLDETRPTRSGWYRSDVSSIMCCLRKKCIRNTPGHWATSRGDSMVWLNGAMEHAQIQMQFSGKRNHRMLVTKSGPPPHPQDTAGRRIQVTVNKAHRR